MKVNNWLNQVLLCPSQNSMRGMSNIRSLAMSVLACLSSAEYPHQCFLQRVSKDHSSMMSVLRKKCTVQNRVQKSSVWVTSLAADDPLIVESLQCLIISQGT